MPHLGDKSPSNWHLELLVTYRHELMPTGATLVTSQNISGTSVWSRKRQLHLVSCPGPISLCGL